MTKRTLTWAGVVSLALACCGVAQAQSSSPPEFIQARVTITNINFVLAVDIPDNAGTNTLWDIGTVPAGGVADTWYDDDLHGSFRLRNAGDLPAHIYIVAERHNGFDPWGGLPTIEPTQIVPSNDEKFAIAFATNVEDLLPDWSVLALLIQSTPNRTAGNMGFIPPGDYILFDLRYYAPNPCCVPISNPVQFRLAFYALDMDNPSNIPPPGP
jgi:hypothetical protein